VLAPNVVLLTHPHIRDRDLLDKLGNADGIMRGTIERQCVNEQERRDRLAALTPSARRRASAQYELFDLNGPSRDNIGHIHSVLALCSLPYTRPATDVRVWERTQGKMSLRITAGSLMGPDGKWQEQTLPYGSKARLLLIHTCSEAIRNKSNVIEIESTLSGFIKAMGFPVTGGARGTLAVFREQIRALAACRMDIGLHDGNGRARTINAQPYSSLEVWSQPMEKSDAPTTISFSLDFYNTLTKHALPINTIAMRAFANSPRKLDIYFWLAHRMHALNEPLFLPWERLIEQWGEGYARQSNFKRDFKQEIAQIKEVFPKIPVRLTDAGATIEPASSELLSIPQYTKKRSAA
jgi:hypothetical protein